MRLCQKATMAVSRVIPLFYFHTAADVLAVPEPVATSEEENSSFEPHSTRVFLFSVPSLEPSSSRAVVTLMISGVALQSRVVSNGEVLQFSSSLYTETVEDRGIIYARVTEGDVLEARRLDILDRLNNADYEVFSTDDQQPQTGLRTVTVADGAMLKIPVREIVRHFSSVFTTAGTVIAPSIATFTGFADSPTTAFISLPESAHMILSSLPVTSEQQALLNSMPALQPGDPLWQPPIKMSDASWTVFGLLWAGVAIAFLISIGVAYSWYIVKYL